MQMYNFRPNNRRRRPLSRQKKEVHKRFASSLIFRVSVLSMWYTENLEESKLPVLCGDANDIDYLYCTHKACIASNVFF